MEIKISEELKIESDIPFYMVNNFRFDWKPNCHALLQIWGCINSDQVSIESFHNGKIKIWREKEGRSQILFNGYIIKTTQNSEGKDGRLYAEAQSATSMLDWKLCNKSYQQIEKTYADIIQETISGADGRTICVIGKDRPIGKPIIQYQETAWAFSKRLASHLGSCVIADITSESPSLWFGMRNGDNIPSFSENEFSVNIKRISAGGTETVYEVRSRELYMLGDKTVFMGQEMIICGMAAIYENGELTFLYSLKNKVSTQMAYHSLFSGMGLKGTVTEVQGERAKIALDIDGEFSAGYYFYDWNAETGNALYAMPEIGAKVVLNLATSNEQDGFLVHCIPDNTNEKNYHRYIKTREGNNVSLLEQNMRFTKGGQHSLAFAERAITAFSTDDLDVSAKKNVKIEAARIEIITPSELNICQG